MEHWMEACTGTEQLRVGKGASLVDLVLRPSTEAQVRKAMEIAGELKAIRIKEFSCSVPVTVGGGRRC